MVAVYDFGRSEQDAYLVMELVGEGTLRDVLSERGPLSPKDAVGLARQIAEGVAEAHRHGLTHRDLKPSNVLLAADAVAVAYKHVNEEPPPPSTLQPGVPDWLDQLVLRCLAKDPADRPEDAGALSVELGGEGPTAAPTTSFASTDAPDEG